MPKFKFSLEEFKALSPEQRVEAMQAHRIANDQPNDQPNETTHRCFHCGAYFDECQCDGGYNR